MVKVNFYNENGNVSAKVRNSLKEQVVNKIGGMLTDNGLEPMATPNGTIGMVIAETPSGEPIYAEISITITANDITAKKVRKPSEKKTEKTETVVPTIF